MGAPTANAVLDPMLKAVITWLYSAGVATLYSWHSYRSGLATMLHAAGVSDAVIMLQCRWMCEASLHVYRRLGSAEHEANFRLATRANVDSIQAANVVHVVGDQAAAALMRDLNNAPDRTAAIDAFAAARDGRAPPPPVAAAVPQAAVPAAAAPPPPDPRPLTRANAVGRRVLVPATMWPTYQCREHGGHGWEATIVSSTNSTAVVQFVFHRTRNGRPYANERVPITNLVPL